MVGPPAKTGDECGAEGASNIMELVPFLKCNSLSFPGVMKIRPGTRWKSAMKRLNRAIHTAEARPTSPVQLLHKLLSIPKCIVAISVLRITDPIDPYATSVAEAVADIEMSFHCKSRSE
jgi:hypothetical protein